MYEFHKNEQYFFDTHTLKRLCGFLKRFETIASLCAPMLGRKLAEAGCKVTILDIDDRFAGVPGFLNWDICNPARLNERFDIIICDPPFFKIPLSQLFKAISILSHNDYEQRLMISHLSSSGDALTGSFNLFKLQPTSYFPSYAALQRTRKNFIRFYSNLDSETIKLL